MKIRLLTMWRDKQAGDQIEVGNVLGKYLIRRKLAKALGGPPANKAEPGPAEQK